MQVTIDGKNYNLNDYDDLKEICERYSHLEQSLFGKTEDDEDLIISINEDHVITEVYQNNGWVRKNIYYSDCVEELYEGKWK